MHSLVLCCASLVLDQSVSRVGMDLLGHPWIRGTLGTYRDVMAAMLKDLVLAVGEALRRGPLARLAVHDSG